MKISAHVLLKNEARFAWFSIMSVIDYVDKVRIWDTGSTDGTLEIIKKISETKSAKDRELFEFKKVGGNFDEEKVRQEMLGTDLRSKTDWILIVDGDEIWWEESIRKVIETIKTRGRSIESVVVPTYNLVGDIFHYQEERAGRYHLAGRTGHLALRALNCKIPGLCARGEHGVFGWFDNEGKRIEERDQSNIVYIDAPYLHATHLKRSINWFSENKVFKRLQKFKYEIGEEFSKDFYFPEVFFRPRLEFIESPWESMNLNYKLLAGFGTPLKKLYRRTFLPFRRYGY